MILVTGGAGFIGSSLIRTLNTQGKNCIVICDNLVNGRKLLNLTDLKFKKFIDKSDIWNYLQDNKEIHTIFHLGACSDTTEWNGKYLYENNYEFSRKLLLYADEVNAKFIYASSASVYGLGESGFKEETGAEKPINAYAASKLLFDNFVRAKAPQLKIKPVGLRYFNVYGEREGHKGRMQSTIQLFSKQIVQSGECKLFGDSPMFRKGQQLRDFVYIQDCIDLNLWFAEQENVGGIYNVGSGNARTFNEVAQIIVDWFIDNKDLRGKINYIDFPKDLLHSYQFYTEANLDRLDNINCPIQFKPIEIGIPKVLDAIY